MTDYRNSHVGPERGRTYDDRYASGAEKFYWDVFEKPYLEELFSRLQVTHGRRYLDFATGTGRIIQLAVPNFTEAVGIDISEDMLIEARRKVPGATFVHADITMNGLDIGTFSAISCFRFMLNAQPELRLQVFRSLRKLIDENGVLIVNNHLNKWSMTGMICQASNTLRGDNRHNYLSDNDVKHIMEQCGFAITGRYDFGFIPAWRHRLLLPSGWIAALERMARRIPLLGKVSKDRVYICKPV